MIDWSLVLDVGVGVGVFLMGVGILIAMLALARTLRRVNVTLDEVDRQLGDLGRPVGVALGHLGGITATADTTLARVSGVVTSLEGVAGSVADTVTLTKDAISPAIISLGATLAGIGAGLQRLVSGKKQSNDL